MEISEKMFEFVRNHAIDDVNALRLRYAGKKGSTLGFNLDFALIQIEARRKARRKLPSYVENDRFLFPTLLSEEQASNEAVARYHASLISPQSTLLDLTAGLGIDDFEFVKAGLSVMSCEIDPLKCEVLQHNTNIVGFTDKLTVEHCNCKDYLHNCRKKFDAVFADPARRNSEGNKVHALSDCQPDILVSMPLIMNVSKRLMVKTSPLLDITLIRNTVENLRRIHVVCFRGECKEVLIDIIRDQPYEGITVIDLDWDRVISRFDFDSCQNKERPAIRYYSGTDPSELKYLYEPNPGIMKVSDWQALCMAFPDLQKSDPNTHIFLSNTLYPDFPGRVLEIISNPSKKELKALKRSKINVVSRNYPLTASDISRKYGIIPGNNDFLYGFRCNGMPVLIKSKLIRQDQG